MPTTLQESYRPIISGAELDAYQKSGNLILDDRRRKPLWFNGRFLEADALNQQQNYYIAKQEDIARLVGTGVESGLAVTLDKETSATLTVSAGRGFTPSGKLVMLEDDIEVDISELEQIQALNLAFDVSQKPAQSLSNPSGIFVLGLRPVQYTGEPIASYPTDINERRSVEDSSWFEATAVSLIPYTDQGASNELVARRKHIANEIFFNASKKGQAAEILPLAIIAVNNGIIEWIDTHMVRRTLGVEQHELPGLGKSPRILREAHFLQYQQHLEDVLLLRKNTPFSAAEEFISLPPAGPMPLSALNIQDLSQNWFPAGIETELTIIPDDELYTLLEESFSMPPIDLGLLEEQYAGSPVAILMAVPRHKISALSQKLPSLFNPLKSIAVDAVAGKTPVELLAELGIEQEDVSELESADDIWREALQDADVQLWYTRRRTVNFKTDIVSEPVAVLNNEEDIEREVESVLEATETTELFQKINLNSTITARAEIVNSLSKVRTSPLVVRSAINEFSNIPLSEANTKINKLAALRVSERYKVNQFGEGISRLQSITPEYDTEEVIRDSVVNSGSVPELDSLAKRLDTTQLQVFSNELITSIKSVDEDKRPAEVTRLISERTSQLAPLKNLVRR